MTGAPVGPQSPDEPGLAEWLNAALRRSREAEVAANDWCPLCGQPGPGAHDDAACEAKMAAWRPTGILTAHKQVAYVPAPPHELLVDSGGHVCDDTCPPPVPDLPPLPWRTRVRYRAHRVWWAVKRAPGLRLAHKDRIDQDDE
jgi:hypothetical protein